MPEQRSYHKRNGTRPTSRNIQMPDQSWRHVTMSLWTWLAWKWLCKNRWLNSTEFLKYVLTLEEQGTQFHKALEYYIKCRFQFVKGQLEGLANDNMPDETWPSSHRHFTTTRTTPPLDCDRFLENRPDSYRFPVVFGRHHARILPYNALGKTLIRVHEE